MIPPETVEKILDTVRVEDIIGDFVTLKRRGANYMACCPFHNEKTPSFSVSPSKGIYKCFGCGKSGSAVTFLMEYDNMTYPEALRYIAKKYGIEIIEEVENPEMIIAKQKKESLMIVSEFAGKFYQQALTEREGHAIGYTYFKSRGLEDDTIKKFGLGWAPVSRRALIKAARAAGYKEEYLIETGLCTKYEDGSIGDRFFDRVMFPIHSVTGRIIAFGGRTLKKDKAVAKYVNSKESEIYVKNQSLYGIWFAKNSISKLDRCILVEGYLDVISMHQLGLTNVVASSGTSLTENQVTLIRRFTENVTIIYDGDSAGIHAALRGIGLVLEGGLNVKVVLLPDGADPDDFAKTHTLEEVQDFITKNEQDFIEFKTDILLGEAAGDPVKKANVINEIADTIALIPDAIKRTVYVNTCAERFQIDSEVIQSRMSTTRTTNLLDKARREKTQSEHRYRSQPKRSSSISTSPTSTSSTSPSPIAPPVPIPPPDYMPEDVAEPETEPEIKYVPRVTDPNEAELLKFILQSGREKLCFQRDSDFYTSEEGDTVADFIDDGLAEDDVVFQNPAYKKVYDLYFELYDEDLPQDKIQQRLLNNQDQTIASVAASMLIEKYDLTVEAYKSALTIESTILVQFVPKSILVYKKLLMEIEIEKQMEHLSSLEKALFAKDASSEAADSKGSPEEKDYEATIKKIMELTNIKNILCDKLGRVQ